MQYFSRRFQALLVLAGFSLLLMGADSQINSNGTGSVISGSTISPCSRATGSITTRTTNSMVSSVSTSTTVTATSRVTATPIVLSLSEEELARTLKFDRKVLLIAKGENQYHIGRLIGFDEENYQIIAPGIVVSVPEDKSDHILASLRQKLHPLKYMVFVVEMNEGLRIDKIGIIKGTDPYEILRIMQTSGDNYDISNEDVIDRLKEWETHFTFDIIGAENDWVEIEFGSLPKDLYDFADEVYDFCPDAVDQGPGSTFELAKDMQKTRKLFLWWD